QLERTGVRERPSRRREVSSDPMTAATRRATVLAVVLRLSIGSTPAAPPPRSFEATLERLARVAELYRDTALGFACDETIVTTGGATRRVEFAYIFVSEKGKLHDYRTWRSATTARTRGQEVDPRDYGVPRYLASAYLWAFVFRGDRQPHYRLKSLG